MVDWQLTTPVVFLIFNRPETTRLVFSEIARARPPKLLVVADGPRLDRPGEAERSAAARAIVDQVDWPCEVLKNYSPVNLGCGRRVSSGLDWAFQMVEEAIILEDDCLPHSTFFRFCAELLEKYAAEERVMHIGGSNFQFGRPRGQGSYYFSRYPHVWGWATWRRAWRQYDFQMGLWCRTRNKRALLDRLFDASQEKRFWHGVFDQVLSGRIDTWAYRWAFTCISGGALSIVPKVNLVSNIGFGSGATHTGGDSELANVPTRPMTFPLDHPDALYRDADADDFTRRLFFSAPALRHRLAARVVGATRSLFSRTRLLRNS